jgi:hypothetical protein
MAGTVEFHWTGRDGLSHIQHKSLSRCQNLLYAILRPYYHVTPGAVTELRANGKYKLMTPSKGLLLTNNTVTKSDTQKRKQPNDSGRIPSTGPPLKKTKKVDAVLY